MKLKVLGKPFDLKIVDSPLIGSACGHMDASKNEILINNRLCKSMQESTIIHEIIEALNYHLELGLEHNKITSLESGLYQVLKENGMLDMSRYVK